MNLKNLLSIGNLSKQTGTSIRSLRYYDQIGILKPVYVNPENGYRYYSYTQANIVYAIKLCVEIGIPLEQFSKFTEQNGTIAYKKLIDDGKKLAEQKIVTINKILKILDNIYRSAVHGEDLQKKDGLKKYLFPEKYCWIYPFNGKHHERKYYKTLYEQMITINNSKIETDYESGVLKLYRKGKTESFIYVNIYPDDEKHKKFKKNILYIPKCDYYCIHLEQSEIHNMENSFPELLTDKIDKIIIETELFTGNFSFAKPTYELMYCLL